MKPPDPREFAERSNQLIEDAQKVLERARAASGAEQQELEAIAEALLEQAEEMSKLAKDWAK